MPRKSTGKTTKAKRTTQKKQTNSTSYNKNSLDSMKYEIAREFGVTLGPNATSKANGKVGGEITKRLVEKGMNKRGSSSKSNY